MNLDSHAFVLASPDRRAPQRQTRRTGDRFANRPFLRGPLRVLAVVLLFFAASPRSLATHPHIPFADFKGEITAITAQSVTVKGPKGTRTFAIKTGKYSFEAGPGYAGLGDNCVTRTQINSCIAIDLNPADVFKAGDMVNVTYWPTLNQGKEAGNIGYADLEKLRAWIKANKAHVKSE